MRIIVHGQQAFGKSVLEALLERGEDVIAVYCEPDKEGRPADPIKECAVERGLPVYQPKSYRDPETQAQFASLDADLCVMAYVTLFVPEEVLNTPTHGSINITRHCCLCTAAAVRLTGPSSGGVNKPDSRSSGLTMVWTKDRS